MRVKRKHDRGAADVAGASHQPLNEPGVSQVNAVEIADRQGSFAQLFGRLGQFA